MAFRGGFLICIVLSCGAVRAEDHGGIPSPLLELAHTVAMEKPFDADSREGHLAASIEYPYDALVLRIHLIRAARRTIDIQTYIWSNDACSRLVAYELMKASERGVKIRILLDSMGVLNPGAETTFDETTYPGIEIKFYRPSAKRANPGILRRLIHVLTPTGGAQQRMHSKTIVVDGEIGLTGGRNFGNDYFGLATGYNFRDREVLVAGPQVRAIAKSFEAFWNFNRSYHNHDLKDVAALEKKGLTTPDVTAETVGLDSEFKDVNDDASNVDTIQRLFVERMKPVKQLWFVADDPGKKTRFPYFNPHTDSKMTHAFLDAVAATNSDLLMQSPYTIFNLRMRHAYLKRTDHGHVVRGRISTNSLGAADHVLTYAANYRLRSRVVRGMGVEVYELKPHPAIQAEHLPRFDELKERAEKEGKTSPPYLSIHAKTYLFDSHLVYIGTFNLDPRSFYVNGECGVFIDDEDFAGVVRQSLLDDMSARNSWVVASNRQVLGFLNRIMETISSLLPIDLWPIRSTSCFELNLGAEEVGPHDPNFYKNYTDVGSFPGMSVAKPRRFTTSILKTFSKVATPIL